MTDGIAGILLAAGSARRFGANKLLARLPDGVPVGLRAAQNLVAVLPNAIAVVRPGDEALAALFIAAGLAVVENPRADKGMAGSIGAGVRAASPAAGWLIALADMPWIRPATIRALAACLETGASLVAPAAGGRCGHPVGFAARWRSELLSLRGDKGARRLLDRDPSGLVLLPTRDRGTLLDVDVPSDLYP